MHPYSERDVEKLLHLPQGRVRSLVEAGFVSPELGPDNTWHFSFQDLIVLRTAQSLTAANVPLKRIKDSVNALRRRLPESTPLSGLNLSAEADRVVVREGGRRWIADSGQYLLGFEGEPAAGAPKVAERAIEDPAMGADEWFHRGAALETEDAQAAIEAYEKAIAADPALLKARINLGCLLHETGRLDRAERVYREALRANGGDPVLLYDLGVLLEDMGRKNEALEVYLSALRADPRFADCHFNVALLCEALGRPREAIQHLSEYRRLNAAARSE